MSKSENVLHLKINDTTEDIALYTSTDDIPSGNYVTIEVDGANYYIALGDTTNSNATNGRTTVNSNIYAMLKDNVTRVYEDGADFYSDADYTNKLTELSGDVEVVGMKNNDASNISFVSSLLCDNYKLTGFKNPFITKVGEHFLSHCTSLASVYCPNLTDMDMFCCTANVMISITSENFPSLKSVYGPCFGSVSLISIDLPNLESVGRHFLFSCESLRSVNLPKLTSVFHCFLQGCTSLTSINLPSLTTAADYFLADCTSLTSVDLPSLTSIDCECPFNGCTNLKSIYLRSNTMCEVTDINAGLDSPISGFPSQTTIYVPASLIDQYKASDGWQNCVSQFKTLESISST